MVNVGDLLRVVVCTKAFGLGIDIPDVFAVIHWGCPSTLPQFVQEAGRAGRNGSVAVAIVYFSKADVARTKCQGMRNFLGYPSGKITRSSKPSLVCRRKVVVNWFGSSELVTKEMHVEGFCCDVCWRKGSVKVVDEKAPQEDEGCVKLDLNGDLLPSIESDDELAVDAHTEAQTDEDKSADESTESDD
jgi:superfamily II DNA helicase RecQ